MGNCVDRDDPPDPKLTARWESMVGGTEIEPSGLAPNSKGPLRKHFLSRGYGNGLDFQDPTSGYSLEALEERAGTYQHLASGIRIWSQALDLSAPGDEDLEVLFHYLPAAKLQKLTALPLLTPEMWMLLADERALFGQGVYATVREPSLAGRGTDPPVSLVKPSGVELLDECCLVLVVPKADAFNVAIRATPEMMRAFGPRMDVNGSPIGSRDLWVIRCPDVARAVTNSASNCERRWRRIVQFREEQYGPSHTDTKKSLQCLAAVLQARGKHSEAESLLHRISREACPSFASLTLMGNGQGVGGMSADQLDELAASYKAKGQLEDAEDTYRRALKEREAQFGGEHLDTLTSVNNLAMLLKARGKLAEAELLYGRVMLGRESQLGPEHPDTLRSANNLAVCLQARGKLDAAEPLYRVALAGCETTFPPGHADILTNLNNLAGLLKTKDKLQEAEMLYRKALEGREATLGTDHPDVLTTVSNLAVLLHKREKLYEAEQLHRRALAGREAKLPPQHPDLIASSNNLARVLEAQFRHSEAEPLLKRVLDARESRLGPKHPDCIASANSLTLCLQAQGKLAKTESLRLQAS